MQMVAPPNEYVPLGLSEGHLCRIAPCNMDIGFLNKWNINEGLWWSVLEEEEFYIFINHLLSTLWGIHF